MQMYTLGHKRRTFPCPPAGISVAEHWTAPLLKPKKSLAAPSRSTAGAAHPACLGNWIKELTELKHFPAKSKAGGKGFFLATPVLSPDPSTTTHAFVPTQHRGQSKNKRPGQQLWMPVVFPINYLSCAVRGVCAVLPGSAVHGAASSWEPCTSPDGINWPLALPDSP